MFRKKKRTERTPERVNLIAKGLAKRIIKQSDGEISEEKTLILAYRTVACMDFDNKVQMHISLESWADRIIGAYNRGGINIELYEEDKYE